MAATQQRGGARGRAEYGSDVIVDVLQALDYEYVALNPGATFRGLHDSLVNYGGNTAPETILCTHEETAVAMAHGYSIATGRPMAAAVHNIVGLLHSSISIFSAWVDRSPVLVLGGTGPMATDQRRPWIDWIHTALVQGNAVRDFVKWDDQPGSVPAIIDSLLRANQLINVEPQGPAYVCFDAALQELRLDQPLPIPDVSQFAPPSRVHADPAALERAADLLVNAQRPVIMVSYLGSSPEAVAFLVSLAEGLSAAVLDGGDTFNFPSRHPLNLTGAEDETLADADLVLSLNVYDLQFALTGIEWATRTTTSKTPPGTPLIDISLRQYAVRSWANDFGRIHPTDVAIAADCATAVPALAHLCQAKLAAQSDRAESRRQRAAALKEKTDRIHAEAAMAAGNGSGESPIAPAFMAQQVWEAVRGYDWAVTEGLYGGWVPKLWDIQKPSQFLATKGGGAIGTGSGKALGMALGLRGSGRVPVQFQGDGDFLFTPSLLWTAAHHEIPILYVVNNNRSYYNDEIHQSLMAKTRGRPEERKNIGIRIENPEVDIATMARSFGVHGEGPVSNSEDLEAALARAARVVAEEGRCAVVDVVTQNR